MLLLDVLPVGPSFLRAYREYLERVFLQSDDLTHVDLYSVPLDVDPESATLSEWTVVD